MTDELSGFLEGVGLPAIVRFLSGLKKTGWLELDDGEWQGKVAFDQGEITDAALGSRTGLTALEGMVEVLPGAHFAFDSNARPVGEPTIRLSQDSVLARLDEVQARCARGDRRLPSPQAVPSVTASGDGNSEDPLPLDRASLQTLLIVDGKRSVRQIVAERGSFDALWQLASLAEVGLISLSPVSAPATPTTPAAPPRTQVEEAAGHCPRLGFEDDPAASFGRATRLHRCYAGPTPLPLSLDQQRELCLTSQFGRCPRLTAPTAQTTPATAPDPRLRGVRPSRPPRIEPAAADDARIVRLPTGGPGTAAGADATPIRPAPAAGRNPTPLRARFGRAPLSTPTLAASAQVSSGAAVATAATEVRHEVRPRPDPAVAEPEEARPAAEPRESFFSQRTRILGFALGGAALLLLALVAYFLLPQLGSLSGNDSIDTADLPNATRIAAGTPVSDIASVRVTSVPASATNPTTVPASRPTSAAPAAQPTAAAAPTTAPLASPSAGLFDERFATNDANWPSDPQGVALVTNGTYRIATHQAGQFVAIGAPIASVPADVVINATFRKLAGPAGGGYGVIVHDQGDQGVLDGTNQNGHYYVLEVGDKGEAGIWRRDGDHWVDLLPWQHADAIKSGTATNDVSVRAVGDTLSLSVNGTQIATRTDGLLAGGQAGLFVGGDGNQVAVSHFSIQAP
jgi:Domain of unknown function (DUF4388)